MRIFEVLRTHFVALNEDVPDQQHNIRGEAPLLSPVSAVATDLGHGAALISGSKPRRFRYRGPPKGQFCEDDSRHYLQHYPLLEVQRKSVAARPSSTAVVGVSERAPSLAMAASASLFPDGKGSVQTALVT